MGVEYVPEPCQATWGQAVPKLRIVPDCGRVLPVGMSIFASAGADADVLALAYAWEQATHIRHAPTYIPTIGA